MERLALVCCCAASLVTGLAIAPHKAEAEQTNFTLYTRSIDNITDTASTDFPNPGSTFIQASALYTTPDLTRNPVGTIYLSCNVLFTGFDAMCIATLKTSNGTDAINIQGYYTEIAELQNNCGPVVQVLGVSGGTGAYNGAQGQVTVTHTPVNPDRTPGAQCAHTIHDFSFAVSLKNPQNAQ
jgi:hypothetical protein